MEGEGEGFASPPPSHPPLLRLQYAADAAGAAGEAGRQQGEERRPQLDVLVQPLRLLVRPLCLQRLMMLLPPALQVRGHHEECVLALNTLFVFGVAADGHLPCTTPPYPILLCLLLPHLPA